MIGGTLTLIATANDTGNNQAQSTTVTLTVVDTTPPQVTITAPAAQTPYNYGDTVTLAINAADAVGITSIGYETSGAFVSSGSKAITPSTSSANATFTIQIPYGTASSQLRIAAYATDPNGNRGTSTPQDVIITSADITPPATKVTTVANPGSSAVTTVTYQVSDGLADLDHVELYFRRSGIGTFNRYTDADNGNPNGSYKPLSGAGGVISFDSTKTGGDGSYEFYSIGVDKAGNREAIPITIPVSPTDYSGLISYYPFNGNMADQGTGGNNGVATGVTLATDRFGAADKAAGFNGSSDFVTIGSPVPANLQLQNELTLAAWIYVTQYPGSGTLGTIIGCQNDPNGTGYAIHLDGRTNPDSQPSPAGHLHFQIGNGSWHTTNTNAQIPLNQWVHVAATRKANEAAKIYYDGVLQPSTSLAWDGAISYNGAEMDIGRQSDYSNRYFNGRIDDVQIYNRALSDAEIRAFLAVLSPDQSVTFNAGTVWSVISTPTAIGEGDTSYDNKNIRVTGTTLTVNGQHSFHNVDLLNGAKLTHAAATTTTETKLDLSVWSVNIDSTSSINVDGKGYLGGKGYYEQGRTVGNAYGSNNGAGGSYGGLGGSYSSNPPNNVYGYLTDPENLGSGGGAWGDIDGGDGGGLIKLNAIHIAVDGSLQSNGGESNGSAAGDGSGGGINIVTSTISGNGKILANAGGSGDGTGGGGGRIAITNTDMSTLKSENVKALGGVGSYGSGANGTVVFIQPNKSELVLTGQGPSSPWTDLTLPAGYVFDSVTFRDNARVIAHDTFTVTGKVLVTGNSILTHATGNEAGLTIKAKTVQVDQGSYIDVTGRGYAGGTGYYEQGRTLGNVYGASTGAGGSYGGVGSGYQGVSSGPIYGTPQNPVYLGSGGGAWGDTDAGNGGGRITINAIDSIIVNGGIRADGGESNGSAAGSGSGGSILLQTSKLAGSGSITANGGATGVGGGGGRIAAYLDYVDSTNNLQNLYNITTLGKTGGYDSRRTTPGTVYIKYSNQEHGNLYIDAGLADSNGNPNASSPDSIIFTPIGFGATTAVTADTLTTDGLVSMHPGSLPGTRLNPDVTQAETFVIQANTANTITVATPNEHGINFADVAGIGKQYAGSHTFDNLIFRRGGNLMLGDLMEIKDTLSLAEYGVLTHYDATTNFASRLDITVKNLDIGSTGRIDVTGRGYLGGKGYYEQGRTLGNILGGSSGAGGSYGGLAQGYQGSVSNSVYGSLTNPLDLGSGGGAWGDMDGGDGGGLIIIRAENIRLDGAIKANGGESGGSAAGDGSGGSVNIVTAGLEGNGTIQANGGGNGDGSGGGGGRIAIRYSGALTLPETNISAIGGTGSYGSPGGNGTVYLNGNGQVHGNLVIDGFGHSTPSDTTIIPGGYTFDNLTIRNAAQVVADDTINVSGALIVTGNSILTHSVGKENGLTIYAGDIRVDQGSAIDTTGRGYQGGKGYYEQGRTLGNIYGASNGAGGSYGGVGGGYQGNSSYLVYGDPKNPVYMGSGGGAWGDIDGGNGGGRVNISALRSIMVNGGIRANGGDSAGSAAGGGSGGSIVIHTPLLAGTGYIEANGGNNGPGGGGGRIAMFCDTIDSQVNLNNLRNITAFSGRGSYNDRPATAGTIYLKYTGGENYLYIDDNMVDTNGVATATASQSTPLTPIGFGATSEVSGNTLVTDGLVPLMPGGLAGLRINPDVNQNETFAIQTNTGNSIMVLSPNENGYQFSSLAGSGKTYAGLYNYDNIIFRRGGNLVIGDLLKVSNKMNISEYGLLTHYGATSAFTSRISLTVRELSIDPTGRIDVTGRGYLGGKGYYEQGRTIGNVYGSANGAGGSYGGLGGGYQGNLSNSVYGSLTDPNDLGSGGGAWGDIDGGNGGGLIKINAENILLNGMITANGGLGNGSASGDGSGGTVNIVTVNLTGIGSIQANGAGRGAGGGGGRISLLRSGQLQFPTSNITVLGGQGTYGSGTEGTVYPPRDQM